MWNFEVLFQMRSLSACIAKQIFLRFQVLGRALAWFILRQWRIRCCLAVNAGAAPEVVLNNKTGVCVEYGDIPAIAGALEQLVADADWRMELGEPMDAIVTILILRSLHLRLAC